MRRQTYPGSCATAAYRFMAEPQGNYGGIYTCLKQFHRSRVPSHVRWRAVGRLAIAVALINSVGRALSAVRLSTSRSSRPILPHGSLPLVGDDQAVSHPHLLCRERLLFLEAR